MGDTSLTLSPIGFGAFKIGRNENVKYAQGYPLPDQHAVDSLLNGVLDLGINYIDTAPAYGLSEERIGEALAGRRDEFVLSSKVGESFVDGRSVYDFSASGARESVERSLRRLRTDVLDIVFVHASRDDMAVLNDTEVVEALQGLRDGGLIRRMGFSGYTIEAVRSALSWSDAIMVEYHSEDLTLEPVIAEAAERGIRVIVKKGLSSGRLDAGESVQFVLSNEGVTSLLVGSLNLEHMRENLREARCVRADECEKGFSHQHL